MASHNSSLDYRLLIHLTPRSYTAISRGWILNRPDPTTELSLTPLPNGYNEAMVPCRSTMLTPTPPRSFTLIPRVLDAFAFICAEIPRRDVCATGLQIDHDSKDAVFTISSNIPQKRHSQIKEFVEYLLNILEGIASYHRSSHRSRPSLVSKLQRAIFVHTLPQLRDRLDSFGANFREWVDLLEKYIQGEDSMRPPFDTGPTRQFARYLAELCREILKAVDDLPNIAEDEATASRVQDTIMVKVPQLIKEMRKVQDSSATWKAITTEITVEAESREEPRIYHLIAKIAAFSTHTTMLVSAALSKDLRAVFSTYKFTVKLLPSHPPLEYTLSPPDSQEAAAALMDAILKTGDPDNYYKLDRAFVRFHVRFAPEDDQSEVLVHSEVGLLLHYLKIIGAILRGEGGSGETAPPFNYIGTSRLQCTCCRTLFRVLEEAILPHTIPIGLVGAGEQLVDGKLRLKFGNRGTERRYPIDWGWPKGLVEVVQGILIATESLKASNKEAVNERRRAGEQELGKPRPRQPNAGRMFMVKPDPGGKKFGWPVRILPRPIADPASAIEVQTALMTVFTNKMSELVCETWRAVELNLRPRLSRDWRDAKFKLGGFPQGGGATVDSEPIL